LCLAMSSRLHHAPVRQASTPATRARRETKRDPELHSAMPAFALPPTAVTRMTDTARVPRVGGPAVAGQRPRWFRAPAPGGQRNSRYVQLAEDLRKLDLHTVCEEAQCPK
jgi:hypothetical protein